MQLIKEIEISYFRSFYKFRLRNLEDMNVIFGKNDSGKSNLLRALSLFFSGKPDHGEAFDFVIDFCDQRSQEAETSEDIRKFLYVKVTFNTPASFQKSLGKTFYVKRQWTVSRGAEYVEEVSKTIPSNRRHILTRLMNKIRFIHIPAIKDLSIFERLLSDIYETLSEAPEFDAAIDDFAKNVQGLTEGMFANLPVEVSGSTRIGAPTKMAELFETLDFETEGTDGGGLKSLTRQRGDGIKARHIPELLNYISKNDAYDFHIWGFEEPENSLDFVAAQGEAVRFVKLAQSKNVQLFITTHSPSFYLLDSDSLTRVYVDKDQDGLSQGRQGRDLERFDIDEAIGEGFYLPAVSEALKSIADIESRASKAELNAALLVQELAEITKPVVLTEGRTDAKIIEVAWSKRRAGSMPFRVRSCETGVNLGGSGNGGADSLAVCLKGVASDNPHPVIGLFDYDETGLKAFKLDNNFKSGDVDGGIMKKGIHGKSYAVLLPIPEFREECRTHENCPIEFLFRDEHLQTQINGAALELKSKTVSRKVGSENYEFALGDGTHLKDVGGNKTFFSEKIVPTLPEDAFDAFDAVFDLIDQIATLDSAAS